MLCTNISAAKSYVHVSPNVRISCKDYCNWGCWIRLPIGFVAGVGDFAFPFATEPLAIDFPLSDNISFFLQKIRIIYSKVEGERQNSWNNTYLIEKYKI